MKCKKQGCNREFKTEHAMKIHYYQMHIRTFEEGQAIITKMKITTANRSQEEEAERIRQMLETTAKRTPEEKAKSIEKGVKARKTIWVNKTQKEKDDIVKQYRITIANKSEEEMIEWQRKIQYTRSNWTLEQKEMNIEHRRAAWEKKSQAEKDELTRQMLETTAKRTPKQKAETLIKTKKTWENMSQEKLDARYLKTLATWKKNGKGKIFMGEWYQSILEADIAKLLWENLGCIFIVNVNREFSVNGSRIDFYPRILGCFIEPHAMNTLYEPLLVSQRDEYKKKRLDMKNKNGYADTELIHYISFKEAKESIEWISDKIADYSPKSLLHSIVNEHEEYK